MCCGGDSAASFPSAIVHSLSVGEKEPPPGLYQFMVRRKSIESVTVTGVIVRISYMGNHLPSGSAFRLHTVANAAIM